MGNDTKKPEEQKPESDMARAVREGIAEGIAAATVLAAKARNETYVPAPKTPATTCQKCRQLLPLGLTSDTHKHRLVAVYPSNSKYGIHFQGVFINGVRYLSNHGSHKIYIPDDSNVENTVQMWEQNEESQANGKVVEHNSGAISSRGPSHFIPAGGGDSSFR